MSKRVPLSQQLAIAQRALAQLEASMLHTQREAYTGLPKAGKDSMMASGVIVTLTALGGRQIVPPFVITDGLSPDTIQALQHDLAITQMDTIGRNKISPKGDQS